MYGGTITQNSKFKAQNNSSKLKIIFIGRLEKDTGISIYLKALDILKEKNIAFTFEAYGDGTVKNSVASYGKVHGFVATLSPELEKTDIVFASSYLSILEAFAKKKIVFSVFDNPLKKDYLTMTPFYQWIHTTDSPETLAEHIFALLKNKKEYHNSIEDAFAWVEKQTWENVVNIYYRLWKLNL